MAVSKLQIVPVREAFRHEALNFTVWLETNIETLSERIGFDLTVLEREKAVGSFSVDLFCKASDGRHVIVENQLERTDHDHLGKLLTYLVNLDAKVAIWVTPETTPEHERVIDWLNEATSVDYSFYLVRVEAVRIADSPFAPLFTVLAAPDEQTREIGDTKKALAEEDRHQKRLKFWSELFDKSRGVTRLFANISPRREPYVSTTAGQAGFQYGYSIRMTNAAVWLAINFGPGMEEKNRAVFDALYAQKDKIEQEFGNSLEWMPNEDQRGCSVTYFIEEHGGLASPETWSELQNMTIDAMIHLDQVFKLRLTNVH